jgi:hypothetical protein
MTARRAKAAHDDDMLHKEPPVHDRTARSQQGNAEQGVVKDERGQEQPADKKRAMQNR